MDLDVLDGWDGVGNGAGSDGMADVEMGWE